MDSRQLRYFVAVARERNFTRAAEMLHIAQPPLSRQIQQLEQEFGVTLIDRGSRPLALTDAGRLLLEQALQVIDRMDEIKAMLGRIRGAKKHRLSIGFVGSGLYGDLPKVIQRYRMARPGVELTLLEMTTLEQIAALREGRVNVGFGRLAFDDPLIQQSLLHNEKLCAALPLRHALAVRRGPLRLEELAGDPLIIYPRTPRPSYADKVVALLRKPGTTPPAL
jgi:LysR family transcriptional regulator, benzoate and cis,cis-muconate-responsive activator of ben and cat genes